MVLVGVPIGGVYLFPAALTADIVDDDSLCTGMRREAMYFGSQNFVEKTASSVTPAVLAGLVLLGDTAEETLAIRLVGVVAGISVLCGYFRRYDLSDDVFGSPGRRAGDACVVVLTRSRSVAQQVHADDYARLALFESET